VRVTPRNGSAFGNSQGNFFLIEKNKAKALPFLGNIHIGGILKIARELHEQPGIKPQKGT
jgi:hypothetical protein